MEDQNYIYNGKNPDHLYNGKRFKYREDFEQEFKPTKWSIRKFMNFVSTLELYEKHEFAEYTIERFQNYDYIDKDTRNFIIRIREKRDFLNELKWSDNKVKIGQKITVSKTNFDQFANFVDLLQQFQDPNKKEKKSYDPFIFLFAMLRNKGIIEGTASRLSKILKKQFGVKLSLSTIESKINKINENNLIA